LDCPAATAVSNGRSQTAEPDEGGINNGKGRAHEGETSSKLGANPKEVHLATRSRKGYWRISANSIVQRALNNRWLKEQGVPELKSIWLKLHHRDKARPKPRDLNGTARCGPARRVVWEG